MRILTSDPSIGRVLNMKVKFLGFFCTENDLHRKYKLCVLSALCGLFPTSFNFTDKNKIDDFITFSTTQSKYNFFSKYNFGNLFTHFVLCFLTNIHILPHLYFFLQERQKMLTMKMLFCSTLINLKNAVVTAS